MKTRKKLLAEIRLLTKAGHGGHKKFIEKIEKVERIKHHIPGLAGLPTDLQNEWDDDEI